MKRLSAAICLITVIVLGFAGCGGKVAIIDAGQSNLGGRLLNPVIETDIGYYFNSTQREHMSLRYFDKQTGKTVYLCVKPECRHDGSSYCTATDSNIEAMYTALYDNKLYIVGIEDGNALTLYRASLDGTEFTRLSKLMEIPKGFKEYEWSDGAFLIHRGKAFIPYNIVNTADDSGLVGMYVVNLSNLKHELVDERERYYEYDMGITSIKAAGDYVYYIFNGSAILSPQNPVIKRYNIKTGEAEEILNLDRRKVSDITNFALIGDELWYSIQVPNEGRCYIMIYDTISGETREFEGELFNTVRDDIVRYFGFSDILYDGTYLYISENCVMYSYYADKENPPQIYIYSLDGKRLAQFSHEYAGQCFSINVIDGKVYFQTEKLIDSCLVQDILDGNAVWKTEVVIEELSDDT